MRFLQFLACLLLFCGALSAADAAHAQESVSARTATHKGYSRLVFEWPSKPAYSLSKEGDRVLIRFAKAGTVDGAQGAGNVRDIKTTSSAGEPLQVAVTIPEGSRFRDFIVGNKLILDVYDSETAQSAVAPAPAQPPEEKEAPEAQTEAPQPAPPKVATSENSAQAPQPAKEKDFSLQPATPQAAAPVGTVEANPVAPAPFDAHVITMTTITTVGLSAFERNGYLWMVIDAPEAGVEPQVNGPQKDRFPKLEPFDVEGAAGYRMELPDGMAAKAEGGGLSWRIVIAPEGARQKAASVEASADGKLRWPLQDMRKSFTFTDPLVGDRLTTVTSLDAAQTGGPSRNFVNLETMENVVGLTYAAKTDDVAADVTTGGIVVGRPGGLSLSSAKDLRPQQIRTEVEGEKETPAAATGEEAQAAPENPDGKDMTLTEPPPDAKGEEAAGHAPDAHMQEPAPAKLTGAELSKAAEEKPSGNNIFNFSRWEMGGLPALEANQHVMMVELSQKQGAERVADMITLSKMLLANNRGAEALGMLRIALGHVPELEENKEFKSLRGAALALSGKFDEALNEFTQDALKDFDDVKYWRAYTLAGLEDWKQAGDVLPADIGPVAAYPVAIRTPMALAFAEVDLRNGRVEAAQALLTMMEPDVPKFPLPYASSWKYLSGEAERQAGNPIAAEEAWTPLVKNGKDDLFRAKAGLSLTKLQLDEKKIKPAEAIDRLEGLRYAWRGDELETLVNYRLGQMYIDNKDYLKGLTVLRNASTLSPETQIGRDVTTAMTNNFRDIFMNDRLKTLSPLDAISIYEEFKDLTPPGPEGNAFVEKLAERLVDADLLGRAAALLEYQVNNRLQGDKKAEVAIRLAAIRLLDGNPDGALRSLEIAQGTLDQIAGIVPAAPATTAAPPAGAKPQDIAPQAGETAAGTTEPAAAAKVSAPAKETVDPEKQRQVYLLKARALSMKKKPDEAMAILDSMTPDKDVNRLRTDIAWMAGKWQEAAISLNDLIVAEDISARRPLTEYQRDLILNRAIALNLSGDRVALANLRERHNAQMKDTTKGQMFEVVTRPRRPDMIGSREAIESMISEIDLFQGFLDGYGKMSSGGDAKEPAAAKEPVPAGAKTPDAAPKAPAAAEADTKGEAKKAP